MFIGSDGQSDHSQGGEAELRVFNFEITLRCFIMFIAQECGITAIATSVIAPETQPDNCWYVKAKIRVGGVTAQGHTHEAGTSYFLIIN